MQGTIAERFLPSNADAPSQASDIVDFCCLTWQWWTTSGASAPNRSWPQAPPVDVTAAVVRMMGKPADRSDLGRRECFLQGCSRTRRYTGDTPTQAAGRGKPREAAGERIAPLVSADMNRQRECRGTRQQESPAWRSSLQSQVTGRQSRCSWVAELSLRSHCRRRRQPAPARYRQRPANAQL